MINRLQILRFTQNDTSFNFCYMVNNFLELIRTRRSCRHYKPEQITDEELHAVLEAGTYAPTSRGLQSPYIVAVQNLRFPHPSPDNILQR